VYGIKGMKMPESHIKNTSKAMMGNKRQEKKRSDTTKKKISKKLMKNRHTFGYKHSEGMKLKCSLSKRGDKNHAWRGGISFEPYSLEWTKEIKSLVKQRDNYRCHMCLTKYDPESIKLHVHHINYDKKNCLPENLITLCNSCHSKTNHNRKHWIEEFKEIVNGKFQTIFIDVE